MPTRLAGEAICHTWGVFCSFQTFCREFCAKNAFSKSAFRMLAKILTSSQKKLPRNGPECEKRFLKKRFFAQKRVQKNFCQFCPRRPPTPPPPKCHFTRVVGTALLYRDSAQSAALKGARVKALAWKRCFASERLLPRALLKKARFASSAFFKKALF